MEKQQIHQEYLAQPAFSQAAEMKNAVNKMQKSIPEWQRLFHQPFEITLTRKEITVFFHHPYIFPTDFR